MVKKGIYFIILIFFYTLSLNAIQIKVDLLNEANSIIIQNKITASLFYNKHNKYNNVLLNPNKKIKEKSVLKIKRTIDIKNNIPKNEFYEHFVKKIQNTIRSNKKNKIQISSGKFYSNKSYNKNNYINSSYMLKNSISNLIIFRNSNFRFYTNKTNVMDSYNIIGLFYVCFWEY
ncbi:MAG: hypothetical protein KatS3mg129_2264 [Leptospiraceae bacterium]|nr:MAG: hypothetical protein KatS3mg129_2264 [Leptospiraceae bacterium]